MNAFLNSVQVFLQDGFMYSILAMGYFISYTSLDFPDLTVEGTVLSGGVVFALLVRAGVNPWLAMLCSFIAGALLGSITGLLNVKLKIRPLLCGILVSTGLISVNLVASVLGMGGDIKGEGALTTIPLGRTVPNIFREFPANLIPEKVGDVSLRKLVVFFAVAVIFKIIMDLYLKTKNGLLLRAAGNNPQYVKMLAKDPGNMKILGLAVGNAYAAVSGALIVQSRANVNQSRGIGMIGIGLASLIIGLSVFGKVSFMKPTTKVIIGAVIYQACLVVASLVGIPSSYNKLLMAVLFTLALVFSDIAGKKRGGARKNG